MDKDYEKIGREFMDISNKHDDKYDEAMKSAGGPREVFAILDRFAEELRQLWQENR